MTLKNWAPGSACSRIQDDLERHIDALTASAPLTELLAAFSSEERAHIAACEDCHAAAEVFHSSHRLMQELPSHGAIDAPWFASRVMAAIAARERESALASPWPLLPRFAARFALLAAALVLFAGAWVYQKPPHPPSNIPAASSVPDSLFDTQPPPKTQDDVLISLAETKP
jgi:hypothetical protein